MPTLQTTQFTESEIKKLLMAFINGLNSKELTVEVVAITKPSERIPDKKDLTKSDQSVIKLEVNGKPGSMYKLMKGLNDGRST